MRTAARGGGGLLSLGLWLWLLLSPLAVDAKSSVEEDNSLKYFQTPMHEIIQNDLYIGMTQYGEYAVTYSSKGGDLKVYAT
jgi:hypothetical protein